MKTIYIPPLRLLITITILFVISNIGYCQKTLSLIGGEFSSGYNSEIPIQEILDCDSTIIVTYKFDHINLLNDKLYHSRVIPEIPGFYTLSGKGYFALPVRQDFFHIPNNHNISVELVSCISQNYTMAIAPSYEQLTEWEPEPTDSTQNKIPIIRGFYPATPLNLKTQSNGLAEIEVMPISYNESKKQVCIATELTYKVTFTKTKDTSEIRGIASNANKNIIKNIVLNSKSVNKSDEISTPEGYIVLTTPDYIKAVERFSEWKKRLGFNVKIISRTGWTPESIKHTIKSVYEKMAAPKYLLIIGDHEDIPGQQSHYGKYTYYTDYFYSYITSDNSGMPDLIKGRIPVKSLEEANVVIDKIMNYEMNPIIDNNFYINAIHSTYFQDKDKKKDGIEDRQYSRVTEDLSQYMLLLGKNIIREYYTEDDVIPLRWSTPDYSGSFEVPENLRKPLFKWDSNVESITKAINSGAFYVFHRDHGVKEGWVYPSYQNLDIRLLSNKNKLPVLFSVDCSCGRFEGDCFAENVLKHPNGGAVAVFAASEDSFTDQNDIFSNAIFKSIWPNTNENSDKEGTHRIGEILNQSLLANRHDYHNEIYHCFGDPSMMMVTNRPAEIQNIIVKRSDSSVTVSCANNDVAISFYDCISGMQKVVKSANADFESANPDAVSVVISGHNLLPYIDWRQPGGCIYVQNQEINTNRVYYADKIVFSSSMDNSSSVGSVKINNGLTTLYGKCIDMVQNVEISSRAQLKTNIIK